MLDVAGKEQIIVYMTADHHVVGVAPKISKLKKQLQRRIDELLNLMKETNEYTNNIDDSLIRQIISLKYVDGLTWEQVAASIGGGNTADGVRMIHNRFLGKNNRNDN